MKVAAIKRKLAKNPLLITIVTGYFKFYSYFLLFGKEFRKSHAVPVLVRSIGIVFDKAFHTMWRNCLLLPLNI